MRGVCKVLQRNATVPSFARLFGRRLRSRRRRDAAPFVSNNYLCPCHLCAVRADWPGRLEYAARRSS